MNKKCVVCGNNFISSNGKYCSNECKNKHRRSTISPRTTNKCVVCGESFLALRKDSSICSEACRKIYKNELNKKYHNDARFDSNREKVLIRDNYTCQLCGSKEKLVVHHKDKTGQTENPNNRMNNLITVCGSCHQNIFHKHDKPRNGTNKVCPICNNEFYVKPYRVNDETRGKYCSPECMYKAMSEIKQSKTTATCLRCGKEFHTTPYKLSIGKSKYCSRECAIESNKKTIEIICKCCGNKFTTIPSRIKDGRGVYCSKQCEVKGRSL